MDRYRNFQELAASETAFTIDCFDRGSEVTICAPHGGNIEPHTAEIAALIAGSDFNLYCFNGCKADHNRDLHITSHRFDHDAAVDLVSRAVLVVAIHGCRTIEPIIHLGGLDNQLILAISRQLQLDQIPHDIDAPRYRGRHPENICNRGRYGQGVQLEISRGVRDSVEWRRRTAAAVQGGIKARKTGRGKGVTSPSVARKVG